VLDGRQAVDPPILMSDGLARNRPGDHQPRAASFIAHARRKHVEFAVFLRTLRDAFRTDQLAEQRELPPPERLLLHEGESAVLCLGALAHSHVPSSGR